MARAVRTFTLTDLGCKVNQVDGQIMRERLADLGWREVPSREPADLAIINTCTVTARADEKCRKAVRRAVRRNPQARVIVTGCGVVRSADRFAAIPGVSAVLTRAQMMHVEQFLERGATPDEGDPFTHCIHRFAGHTRGFLRIQDGCESHCAYCIVPLVRGPLRSRPLDAIREEARTLVEAGHRELVLTGIHVGRYGADLSEKLSLADVVAAVLDIRELTRLRLSSIEAPEVTERLLDVAASDARFAPHFHLPLQSGDDTILRAMHRPYTTTGYLRRVELIRSRFDRPAVGSDILIGFPGETEAHFANTLAVCREAGFSRIHIFPFSPRPGTPAAELPERVRGDVIREREGRLKALADDLALSFKRPFVGEIVHPLIEHRRDRRSGRLAGWSARYLRTECEGPDELMGRIVAVRVTDATPEKLIGAPAAGDQALPE